MVIFKLYSVYFLGYDFKLRSLLVIDDFGEGLPIGWCLSNKEDFGS